MKKTTMLRQLAAGLLVFIMALTLCLPFSIQPVKAEGKTYIVRVFAGKQGKIDGKDVKEFSVKSGEDIDFKAQEEVKVNNKKYYVRGIREAGLDNNTVSLPKEKITKDTDYVVAYGIKGTSVAYTVNYVDRSGKTLAAKKTYYGNVGDKPVVAYEYIDGYFPQARNITGTLKEDASKNQFTFVYTKIEEETTTSTTATTTSTTRQQTTTTAATTRYQYQTTTSTTRQTVATTGSTSVTVGTTGSGSTTATTRSSATTAAPTVPTNPNEVPDLIDIDDQTTPMAEYSTGDNPDEATTESGTPVSPAPGRGGMSTPAKIGVGIGSVAAIAAAAAALYYFLVYKNPATSNASGEGGDEEEDEDAEDETEA